MSDPRAGYEPRDINLRVVLLFATGLTVFGLLAHGMVLLYFARLERRNGRTSPGVGHGAPPPPRLEQDSDRLLQALRDREEHELGSYGWADRGRGIVRIPIERAMDLLLEKGLPARKTTEPR